MTPQDIQAAFEARQSAVASLRELADETQGRDMSAEETQTFERQNDEIDALDARIQSGLKEMEREAKATEAIEQFRALSHVTEPTEAAVAPSTTDEDLFRQLLNGEIRSFESKGEKRDLTEGSATAGGNLVTSTLYDRVIDKFTEEGVALAAGATLLETASGEDMLVPTVTGYSTGALVAEGGTISESDPTFGQSTISVYKYAAIVEASSELIEDNGVGSFNVLNFVADQGGAAVARALSAAWTAGSGSSQPNGYDNCTAGVTAASATAITANELIDLQHSITAPYRIGAAWAMNDSTLKAVRKLVDSNGQYVWQPGLRVSNPDELLGAPVYTDTNMEEIATGKKTVVYGNFTRGYFCRIAGGVRVESSNAPAFTTDLISTRFIVRGGGNIIDTNALRHLVQA
ncbi:MAG: phage major capsid protein [Gammaproteobacteria bacterium]|nr:phage major capsid protein [Gammaproteobacteria bacterium]